MDPMTGPMAEMGAPDFSGAPTEAKRINDGGWCTKDKPASGNGIPDLPMPSTDPEH